MSGFKIAAMVLIAAGALALIYGSFSYTRETHRGNLGSLELTLKDKETVRVPVWLGVAAVVAGGAMLVVPRKRS
jgi:TRAP-type C4-dicarboxylate transport system permease small subunit